MTITEGMDKIDSKILKEIEDAAATGEIKVPWVEFKRYLKLKLEQNYKIYLENEKESESSIEIQDLYSKANSLIEHMLGRPFTFQRICEILLEPKPIYPTLFRYLNAIVKLCMVVTYDEENNEELIDQDEINISVVDFDNCGIKSEITVELPPKRRLEAEDSKNDEDDNREQKEEDKIEMEANGDKEEENETKKIKLEGEDDEKKTKDEGNKDGEQKKEEIEVEQEENKQEVEDSTFGDLNDEPIFRDKVEDAFILETDVRVPTEEKKMEEDDKEE
ncbi:hypothetical protein K502DRAFT_351437 [Neoconidiobolus thromboides FSU 785]|nr:hypothetical protein K502DRAFT_351437 [Neoconidiobolus thromboides FSU 785]